MRYTSDVVYAASHQVPRGPGVRELHAVLMEPDPNQFALVAYVNPRRPDEAYLVKNDGRNPSAGSWTLPWWASGLFAGGITGMATILLSRRFLRRWKAGRRSDAIGS